TIGFSPRRHARGRVPVRGGAAPMLLSVVIPVFNEVQSLDTLYGELARTAEAEGYDLDVVLVDDGSTDGSWPAIKRLAQRDARVRGIRFRRNFGKAAALSAGFQA